MWSPADLTILVPVLHRPWRVERLLSSITSTTPEAEVLFLCTVGDRAQIAAVEATSAPHIDVGWRPGDYARKIQAGYEATNRPLLFLGADDLLFHPGWFPAAAKKLTTGIGVVGTNDLTNPRVMSGKHATHSLVTRAYVDEFGTIDEPGKVLHEGYVHEFVDDELVGTAKRRGAWAFATDAQVEHLHPMAGKAPMDELYAAQASRMAASRDLYRRRCRLWT